VNGCITLTFEGTRDFSDDDVDFMMAVAHQCALALERARLFDDHRQQVDALAKLHAISASLSSALTKEEVASVIDNHLKDTLGAVITGVLELSEDGNHFVLLHANDWTDGQREVLGAKVVRREQVQRPRQRPEARLELTAVGALEALVPLPRVALEQERDVRPATSLAFGHGLESSGERAVRVKEVSGGVIRVARQRAAPVGLGTTLARGVRSLRRAIILHEIANSLPGDPTISRNAVRRLGEPIDQRGACGLRLWRLRRWRELTVIPPVAEPADTHVAASGASTVVQRKIRATRTLEVDLRRAGTLEHALRVGRRRRVSGLKRG
jgi:hypothetical protein